MNEILKDIDRLKEIQELARRNCFGITSEDNDYIIENITEILFAVYFVFKDYLKLRQGIDILKDLLKDE